MYFDCDLKDVTIQWVGKRTKGGKDYPEFQVQVKSRDGKLVLHTVSGSGVTVGQKIASLPVTLNIGSRENIPWLFIRSRMEG